MSTTMPITVQSVSDRDQELISEGYGSCSIGILLIQFKNTATAVERWSSAAAFKRSKIQKTRKKSKISEKSKISKFYPEIQRHGIIYRRTAETSSQEVVIVVTFLVLEPFLYLTVSHLTVIQ